MDLRLEISELTRRDLLLEHLVELGGGASGFGAWSAKLRGGWLGLRSVAPRGLGQDKEREKGGWYSGRTEEESGPARIWLGSVPVQEPFKRLAAHLTPQ